MSIILTPEMMAAVKQLEKRRRHEKKKRKIKKRPVMLGRRVGSLPTGEVLHIASRRNI